jgi:hypothetical protein
VKLRIADADKVSFLTALGYKANAPISLDATPRGTVFELGTGHSHLMHGTIECRRYPSYAVYVSTESYEQLLFFTDASTRNLLEIAISQRSELRRIQW